MNDPSLQPTIELIAEADLHAPLRARIRTLLVAAYPQFQDYWSEDDFWGGPAEARLLLMHGDEPVAHLGFGRRMIRVGERELRVAGIGAVATHPRQQRCGLGRRLFAHLQRALRTTHPAMFGFLQCREAVVPFYRSAGLTRVRQPVRSFDPDDLRWGIHDGPAMVLPALRSMADWPDEGVIDLRGMPW